jgi:hypothetical protein
MVKAIFIALLGAAGYIARGIKAWVVARLAPTVTTSAPPDLLARIATDEAGPPYVKAQGTTIVEVPSRIATDEADPPSALAAPPPPTVTQAAGETATSEDQWEAAYSARPVESAAPDPDLWEYIKQNFAGFARLPGEASGLNQLLGHASGIEGLGGLIGAAIGAASALPESEAPSAPAPPAPAADADGSAEHTIGVWLTDGVNPTRPPLIAHRTYRLNFMVGKAVAHNLIAGQTVPAADIPASGLQTDWVVTCRGATFAALDPGPVVLDERTPAGCTSVARFTLRIPPQGDSDVVQIPLRADTGPIGVHVFVYVRDEVYREFDIALDVADAPSTPQPNVSEPLVRNESVYTTLTQTNLRSAHEWATPPGTLSIAINAGSAAVRGAVGNSVVDDIFDWPVLPATAKDPIDNVRKSAETFRAKWETYLNDVDPVDLAARLAQWHPSEDWAALPNVADANHQQQWDAVATSSELRELAFYGREVFTRFFPDGSELRSLIESAPSGQRLAVTWTPKGGAGFIPNVPWGLMYVLDLPTAGEPIDPSGFIALRFRVGYQALSPVFTGRGPLKTLGGLGETHRAHLLYWGDQSNDATGIEAQWQRRQWEGSTNCTLLPSDAANRKGGLLQLLDQPSPSPTSVLYMFCQCKVDDGANPLLRFGSTNAATETVKRSELGTRALVDQPLVFVNACTTAAGDPYIASELQQSFLERRARGFLGTETKVPISFASRFAVVFFKFFYRELDPAPIAAGEAVAQTRLFFWTRYRNIGGILYSYVNQYELFMASASEAAALRSA